jgi:endoglucanase
MITRTLAASALLATLTLSPLPALAQTAWTADSFRNSQVRGFNSPGDMSPDSIKALAATGANVLRAQINLCQNATYSSNCTYDASQNVFTYDDTRISTLVSLASANGIKLVIAFADPDGNTRNLIWQNNAQGTALQNSLNSIWQAVATKYAGDTTIAAFDVLEEPVANSMSQWVTFSTRLINTIREADANRTIIWEPTPWAEASSYDQSYTYTGDPLTNVLPFNNMVYAFDDYDPRQVCMQGIDPYTIQNTYPSPAGSNLGAFDKSNLPGPAPGMQLTGAPGVGIRAFQLKYNVPIYNIGFSCIRWAPVSTINNQPSPTNLVADAIALFESYGWSWNYHSWREWMGWDAELPESFFYSMRPYTNARPNINWSLYTLNVIPNDYDKTQIGFGAHRTKTDTMSLLEKYFAKNTAGNKRSLPRRTNGLLH